MMEYPSKPFMYLCDGNPHTQKAQGLKSLIQEYRTTPYWGGFSIPVELRNTLLIRELDKIDISNATELFEETYLEKGPQFIRPCPRTPKHGFVESRIFDSPQTLVDAARETFEADSLGEILIQEYIPAEYSAVINPNCMTIGRGTDGVTSGKEDTVTFSTFAPREAPWSCQSFRKLSRQNAVACEVLWMKERGKWAVVQMREISPKIGTARTRYIPRDFQVERVIYAAHINPNCLMDRIFSKVSPREAMTTFFTVNTMQSHNAMQLIEHGYAVGERSPSVHVGDKVKKTSDEILPFMTKDLEDLALLLRGYLTKSISTLALSRNMEGGRKLLSSWASQTAKNSLYLDLALEGDRITLSLGLVSMLYMSILACAGEARHFFLKGTGGMTYNGLLHPIFASCVTASSSPPMATYKRKWVYESLTHYKLPKLLAVASRVLPMLDASWHRGYGGEAWSRILRTNLGMYEGIRQFIEAPTRKTLKSLLVNYNEASYLTHNGGAGALSKFGSSGKTELEILGDVGIDVLRNPPLRKEGKLPRFRESTLPSKMSHKREWPPFADRLENPNAVLCVLLRGLEIGWGATDYYPPPIPYVILLPDIGWRESNSPWGFIISGKICLDMALSTKLLARINSVLCLKGITFFKGGWKTTSPAPCFGNLENVQILRKKDFKQKYILDALPHNIAYCTRQYYLPKSLTKHIPSMFTGGN